MSRSPLSLALYTNLAATFTIALIAILIAYMAVDRAVLTAAKEDISREVALMTSRAAEREALPEVAVVTMNIGRRLGAEPFESGDWIYALSGPSGDIIIGNAGRTPSSMHASWHRLNGRELATDPGPVVVWSAVLEGGHHLVVGRRLTARQSLNAWFLPLVAVSSLAVGLLSTLILQSLNSRFLLSVRGFNEVFRRIEAGGLSERVPADLVGAENPGLSTLAENVNRALDEVERLLRGLESYSQVAAHELNHSVSKIRDRLLQKGEKQIAQQAEQLLELVMHMLELAKIETIPGFSMQRLNLSEVVRSGIALYADAFEEKLVTLEMQFLEHDAFFRGSKPLVESAVVNLLSNALKHAPEGSVVTVTTLSEDQRIGFIVRDRGAGVTSTSVQDLSALGRAAGSGGNGFGLRHVEAVAIRHGAQLRLEQVQPGLAASLYFPAG